MKKLCIWTAAALLAVTGLAMLGGGCGRTLSVTKLEARPAVQHYEKMRQQLKRKEQAGTEGGCPTCVY